MSKRSQKTQRERTRRVTEPAESSNKSDYDQTSYTSRDFAPEVEFLGRSLERFQNNFRKKKTGPFQALASSSIEGPFGGQHVSGLVKTVGDSKKIVHEYHNRYQKDPIMQTNVRVEKIRVRMPPPITFETKQLQDTKFYLPSDRKVKPSAVRYHNKMSLTLDHEISHPNPEKTEYISSTSKMKNVLAYSFAKHDAHQVTPKVTQIHRN